MIIFKYLHLPTLGALLIRLSNADQPELVQRLSVALAQHWPRSWPGTLSCLQDSCCSFPCCCCCCCCCHVQFIHLLLLPCLIGLVSPAFQFTANFNSFHISHNNDSWESSADDHFRFWSLHSRQPGFSFFSRRIQRQQWWGLAPVSGIGQTQVWKPSRKNLIPILSWTVLDRNFLWKLFPEKTKQ